MNSFTDSKGAVWMITMDVNTIKRVRALLNVDLLGIASDKDLLTKIDSDLVFVVDLLYAVCKPESDKQGISPEQFAERLGTAEAIESASSAFMESLIGFFRKPQQELLRKITSKTRQIQEKAISKAIQVIDSPEMNQKIEDLLNQSVSGESFMNTPGSLV